MAPDGGRSLAPQTQGVDAALLPYYGQTLTWSACGSAGFDCTTVTAPRDYSDPSAGDLSLAVIRHRATSGEPLGSLLTNPGGPGVSGVDTVRDSLSLVADEALTRSFDVIGFDPRGVGQSTAVSCYDAAGMDSYLYDVPPGARGSDERNAALEQRQADFAQACEAGSNGILPYISTENAARDMDLLRAVLGDEKLNYLGFSYGSLLGRHVRGAVPRARRTHGARRRHRPEPRGQRERHRPGGGLRERPACVHGGLPAHVGVPVLGLGRRRDGRRGVDAGPRRRAPPRQRRRAPPRRRHAAHGHRRRALQRPELALPARGPGRRAERRRLRRVPARRLLQRPGRRPIHRQHHAGAARVQLRRLPREDDADETAVQQQLAQEAPVVAPYWVGPDACAAWPAPPTGAPAAITAPGSPPIVVLGTTGDPATPYAEAQALAAQLSQGVLVTYVGEGHLAYNKATTA